MKHFMLLVVYLLVSLASNFAKKGICQRTVSVTPLTFIEWGALSRKEEKKNFESTYHDVKVKCSKRQSSLVCICVYFLMFKKKNLK